jgi:hypothetical protein
MAAAQQTHALFDWLIAVAAAPMCYPLLLLPLSHFLSATLLLISLYLPPAILNSGLSSAPAWPTRLR